MEHLHLVLILLAILGFAALSRRLESSVLTMPMAFTAFGWLIGQGGADLIPMESEHAIVHGIAEFTLILVLFSDASRIDLGALKKGAGIPARMLLIGMPLTILFGTLVAHWVSLEQSWALALLVAAILTPTDAALGQAVVSSPSVPLRLRQGVNVESGLNDGMALPVVMIAALAASSGAAHGGGEAPDNLFRFAALQVALGPLAGVVIAWLAARLLDFAIDRKLATLSYQGIYFLATALLCYLGAELIGGNGFIAAFVGGLTFGNTLRCSHDFIGEFMESEGQLLTLLTFLIFGAVLAPQGLAHATWKTVMLSLAFLTVVRILPVWLSLTGTDLRPWEKFFLGWSGPRGLASILFALLIVEGYDVPGADEVLACVVLTVLLSIFLHGVTAQPLAASFARRGETPSTGA
ncbi:MAG TPA: sodium:proton antiporter [Thermopetrobacter sp.]|nr:sodium:proton antiporter [Thermopetrobacter sp.]